MKIKIVKVTASNEKHFFSQEAFKDEGMAIITPFLENGHEVRVETILMEQEEWETRIAMSILA